MPQPASNNPRAKLIAVIGTTAAAALVALTATSEGVSLKPYDDRLAGNLQTVCFGETNVAMHAYTLPECRDMLAGRLAGYAEEVQDMTPGFDSLTDGQKVAAIDGAYNFGLGNYRNSTLRSMYGRKQFPEACDQFLRWRFLDHGKKDCAISANKCAGIYKRRLLERAACLGEQ